ncbi:MAG: hypothetical protein K2W96_18340 [Gemmataceae bacterium]|nr:hypothetical protein [Gemmataceae bacterium]
MDRLLTMAARGFASVAVALVVLAVLAVPQAARADSWDNCPIHCAGHHPVGSTAYAACVAGCQSCQGQCAGLTGSAYTTCMDNCYALDVRSSCPRPNPPPQGGCDVNDGRPSSCPGIACADTRRWQCICTYVMATGKCICPP